MASNEENPQDTHAPDTNPPVDNDQTTAERDIARGITIMSRIIRDRDRGHIYDLQWNHTDQTTGPNAAKFKSYIGTLVRLHIPITVKTWKNKDLKEGKDKIWSEIKVP